MQVVIDTNILFSALIKDSTTRRIILEYEGKFLFPEFIFEEMEEHIEELYKKSGMNRNEFSLLLNILLKKVLIISNRDLIKYAKEAEGIVKNIDINDSIFIACALAYNAVIWSDDKRLKEQNKVIILNTKDLMYRIISLP